MSTTRSQLYRFARDLGNVEAVQHGYTRGGLSGAAGGAAQRQARRVIYRELATDPEAILGLVKAAFGKVNSREARCLRVSPADAAVIQEYRTKLQIPPGFEITPDGSLTPGSVIFETTRGDLDASVETQLSEIDRGLTDTLKRRK